MTINDYATLSEVKASFPDNSLNATTTYDALTTSLITRCSRQFDKYTHREPGAYYVTGTSVRYFDGPGYGLFSPIYGYKTERLTNTYTGAIALRCGELADVPTEVAMAQGAVIATAGGSGTYTVVPTTDYYPTPRNAQQFNRPYTALELDVVNGTTRVWLPYRQGIRITAKFGYSLTVPDDVKEGVVLMVIRLVRKAQQNYVETGVLLDSGQVMQGAKLDTDINDIVRSYKRLPI